ncbi:heme NO-binding domain-containing protein [Robiginitalea sediminis]|uniref:heme NO-binding domain-containing protein n=1 Tax=Robiginitalea sediminis TaxID=1982593 RepID=UPI0013032D8E|nr:heme NO-binding domain-containing protein [Robiginitalea sediminis]
MKGFIYRYFLEMVEERFGLTLVDTLVGKADLPSDGVYTHLGNYPYEEMLQLLDALSAETELPKESLLHAFGTYLFGRLNATHPEVIGLYESPVDLLKGLNDHIHFHVQNLYPEAALPKMEVREMGPGHLQVLYESSRGLYRLAHGLMEGVFSHFNIFVGIQFRLLEADGTIVQFELEYEPE